MRSHLPSMHKGLRYRTSTSATPYSLVYKMEPIFPVEVKIQSPCILMEAEIEEVEWIQARYD